MKPNLLHPTQKKIRNSYCVVNPTSFSLASKGMPGQMIAPGKREYSLYRGTPLEWSRLAAAIRPTGTKVGFARGKRGLRKVARVVITRAIGETSAHSISFSNFEKQT